MKKLILLLMLLFTMSCFGNGGVIIEKVQISSMLIWHQKEKFYDWYPEVYIFLIHNRFEDDEQGGQIEVCDVVVVSIQDYCNYSTESYYYYPPEN